MSKSGRNRPAQRGRKQKSEETNGPLWLWGSHAVEAALQNSARTRLRLVATENAARRLNLDTAEITDPKDIDKALPPGAVHQGVALFTDPLHPTGLDDLISSGATQIAVLDQLADPHNLGAIFRSAAAFGFDGIVLQTRHSPPITGIVAKSAAGGIESVVECRVVNIARALDTLADAGFSVIGLSGEAHTDLENALAPGGPQAIVMGAEGSGLRPGVAKACTILARIRMGDGMESLNVSNAAAIAFYLAKTK
ncbi:MAG: RNA methyltransferase [Pseudomonadota bacterium]